MDNNNSHYLALLDGLKDLAAPDNVILGSEDSLSQLDIFQASAIRIKKLFPLTSYAFLLENDDYEFAIFSHYPEDADKTIQANIDHWIDKDIFSWALNQNRAVIEHNTVNESIAVLHSITAHNRPVGMFIGFVNNEDCLSEGNLTLLSVILLNCGKSLEAFDLNAELKSHNENLEQMVKTRTKELETAKDKAEKNAIEKTTFLSTMSHEIRTPMNGVIGMAQILANTQLNPEQKKYVSTITDSGIALTRLINDILDLTKLDAGKLDLHLVPFSLTKLCKEIILLFSAQTKEKDFDIELTIPEDEPHYVIGDQGRLRQILNNLVNNAIKFTTKGSIKIQVYHYDSGNNRLFRLEVTDTGTGITPEAQQRLFKPFSQSDSGIANTHGGTGLGLSICKRLVELMGGDIGVNSEFGEGSTFWIKLKLEKATTEAIQGKIDQQSNDEEVAVKSIKGKVLVAEDNETNQEVITLMLTPLGLDIDIANNGQEAVDALENNSYDFIFMDCQMPVLNGIEATKRICELYDKPQRPPIIALTANAFSSDRENCFKAGMDDFLPKPIEQKSLVNMLVKWLPEESITIDISGGDDEESASPSEAKHSPVDDSVIQKLVSLSPEKFAAIKDNFLNNTKNKLDSLQEAYSTNDIQQVVLIAHSLKGGCATFGAIEMSKIAANLEQAAKAEDMEKIRVSIPVLIDSFEETEECYEKY